jgi:hypothetical protein
LILGARPADTKFSLFGLWPSAEQDLVLRAALLDGEAAVSAFRQWVGGIDLEGDFDLATFSLLPLLYDNLRKLGIKHPLMGRLKGAYRLAWYRNHKLFDDLRPTLASLAGAGVRTMLLKGAPLVFTVYGNHALRPMADIDVLVPIEDLPRAIVVLRGTGWKPFGPTSSDFFRYRHALCLIDAAEREIDLHWHCLFELSGPGNDDFLWSTARPLNFNGIVTLAPDPTRHLIITILHGLRWNPAPPIRWIPDALALMRRAGGEMAWDELIGFARDQRLSCRLHLGLSYLRQRFGAPIPESVLTELRRSGRSVLERIENSVVLRDRRPLHARPIGDLWIILAEYCRYAWRAGWWSFMVGFTHYLRFRWKLRGRLEIPGVVWRGLMKRFRGHGGEASRPTGEEQEMALLAPTSRPSGDRSGG